MSNIPLLDAKRREPGMRLIKKIVLISLGSLCLALGIIGVVVPVLPTTPLVLLAAFLYSRSSNRLNSWLARTSIYQAYVEPFKRGGGISKEHKLRIIAISYAVMGISALIVQNWIVWIILAAVALFLFILMAVKIPTISKQEEEHYGFTVDSLQETSLS